MGPFWKWSHLISVRNFKGGEVWWKGQWGMTFDKVLGLVFHCREDAIFKKYLVRAKCVCTNVVCELVDVMATKLVIIFLLSFFLSSYFLLLLSFHLRFSQKGFAYDFEFLHAFVPKQSGVFAPWESEDILWRMQYFDHFWDKKKQCLAKKVKSKFIKKCQNW